MDPAIEVVNVTKKYGYSRALDSVSLEINQGEHLAILGPNGAGKTTLIRVVATHIVPSGGILKIHGFDAFEKREDMRRRIGLVAHESFLYDELTIRENLDFYGRMFSTNQDVQKIIEFLHLRRWYGIQVKQLSHGLRKRADIARALIHDPDILLFDELFTGLDEETRSLVIDYLRRQRKRTLLISTHSTEWAQQVCDRGIFLERGKLIQDRRF